MTLTGSGGNAVVDTTFASATFAGNLSGPGGLIETGSNTLTLSGTNPYGGGTVINQGNLVFSSTSAVPGNGSIQINALGAVNISGAYTTASSWLGSGKVNANSTGALALTAFSNENINFAGYNTLSLGAVGNETYTGTITPASSGYNLGGGGGTLVYNGIGLTGASSLTINGNVILAGTNSCNGGTVVNMGNLVFSSTSAIPASGLIQINGPGALNISGAYTTVMGWLGSGKINPNSTGALALTASSNENINFAGYNTVSLGATGNQFYTGTITPASSGYNLGGGGTLVYNGPALAGTNSLTINGNVTLLTAQSYSGATTISAGTLQLAVRVLPLANPSFENPALASNSYLYYGSMTSSQQASFAWVGSGNSQNGGPALENASAAWGFTAAPAGAQACAIQYNASISQTVSFPGAGVYPLVWSAEGRPNSSYGSESDPIEVLLDGAVVATYTPSNSGVWSGYTTTLTVATAGTHTIEFLGTGPSGTYATAIDNVSLPAGGGGGSLPATTVLTVAGQSTNGGPYGVFDLGGFSQTLAGLSGGRVSGGGAAYGTVTNGGGYDAVLTVTGTSEFDGVLCDGATNKLGLTVSGGSLTLIGPNTYTGPTTVSGGTLQIGNGGVGEYLASPSITMTNNATLAFDHADTLVYAGSITGSGQLVKQGSGLLTLSGANTYTGGTTVSGGTLVAASPTALGNGHSLVVQNAAAVDFNVGPYFLQQGGTCSVSGGGRLIHCTQLAVGLTGLGNGSLTVDGSGSSVNAGSLYLGGGGATGTATFSNGASGSLSFLALANDFVPGSSGSLSILSGANVTVAGNISVANQGAGTTGQILISGSNSQLTQSASGSLVSLGSAWASAGQATITVNKGGTFAPMGLAVGAGSAAILLDGGTFQSLASFSIPASANFSLTAGPGGATFNTSGNTLTVNSAIGGPGSVTQTGSGELILAGSNTYTGGTSISGGMLDITSSSELPSSGLVTISGGGRLVLGSGAGIGALLTASLPVSSGEVSLTAAAPVPTTLAGYENTSGSMATLGGAPPLSQGGAGSAVGGPAAAVPEPGTFVLLAAGVLMLAIARCRRRG